MEFTEALQEFLFHQGFQRIKYDSKILWGKDTNGKLSLLEIVCLFICLCIVFDFYFCIVIFLYCNLFLLQFFFITIFL